MYIELRHLRTIRAIQQAGGLARAADMLNMTQSALSHQVAGLEAQAGMELFVSTHPSGSTTMFAGRPKPRSHTSSSSTRR